MRRSTSSSEPADVTPARRGIIVASAVIIMVGLMTLVHVTKAGASASNPPLPSSIAAIGDSISVAFDDCCSYGPHPQDSWSTGGGYPTNGVYSHYQQILTINPSISGHAYNDAVSGAKVADTNSQAHAAVAQQAQYVTILVGADDVCTGSISSMTSTSNFQSAFQSTMSTLESGLPPGAHIFVSSIPNIYGLWSALHGNPTAQAVWSLGLCQSMLATANTETQRQQVLTQEEADNSVLSQVCGQYANCKWDRYATFDYQFTPGDVSTLDYFHPSQTGQGTLAALTWNASWWPQPGGYWEVASDGGLFAFGDAAFQGSMGGQPLNKPIVGMAATADGLGYWEVASDGGLFAFGDAAFQGSMGGQPLNKPIVGMAATADGLGYWEVASDGGLFAFGDAAFHGSMGGQPLNKPIVGMAATADGLGYWEVASDGGLFAFGDAAFHGSMGGQPLNKPIVGMAATADGLGYWEVASDGGLFAFGDAAFHGSMGGQPLNKPIVGMAATADGLGYWEVASDGGLFAFGDAAFHGSMGGQPLNKPIVGMATP